MNTSNEKKRLLLIVPMLHQGGFERVCVETARLMQPYFQVTLLIFTDIDAHYDVTGIDLVNIDVPAKDGRLRKAWNLFLRAQKIRSVKRQRKIDVSYSFGATANLANVYSRARDAVITSMRSSLDFDAPDRLRRILNGSDLMISCSKRMKEMLEKEYHFTKTALLYNPLDIERIRAQAKETVADIAPAAAAPEVMTPAVTGQGKTQISPVIAAMGREDDAKGYWHLLKAFALFRESRADARLFIIGEGTFERERALIKALKITEAVTFTGARKNPFPYVAAADLFVLPSNHEGFPNALVEAMALSKPVIACDCISGPREILLSEEEYAEMERRFPDGTSVRDIIEGAYGMLIPDMSAVPDYDAEHITADDRMLCNAMKRLLTNEELRLRYGRQSEVRAAEFAVSGYAGTLRTLLSGVRR